MADESKQAEAGAEATKPAEQTATPQIDLDEITRQIERLKAANAALKQDNDKLVETVKSHNSEMKAKKERERQALEEAGKYKELLEMTNSEKAALEKERADFQAAQTQWTLERKRYAVLSELQRPGALAAGIPPEDVLHFVDISQVEVDDAGRVVEWAKHHEALLKNRDYLKPQNGTAQKTALGIAAPPAGSNVSSETTRNAKLISHNTGIPVEQAERLVQGKDFMEMAKRSGWLREPIDVSRYSPTS